MQRSVLLALAALIMSVAYADEFDMQNWIDEQVASGTALAIVSARQDGGKVTFFNGGTLAPGNDVEVDAGTQFEIGSITKAFTNLLLAEMAARELVRYDTTIGDILGNEIEFANPDVASVTLLQLATHTSGFPRLPANLPMSDPLDPYKDYDERALLQGVGITRDKQPLGNHYAYSNFGVGLLGYLLGRVHGEGYVPAVTEYVLQPLGLERTGFERAEPSASAFSNGQVVPDWNLAALAGAGALRSTTTDLMRVAQVLLGNIENPLAHDLDEDRKTLHAAGSFEVTRVWHVARSANGSIFWHNGGTGGFRSFLGWKPESKEAMAVIVSGDVDPTGLGLRLLGFEPAPPPAPDVDESLFGQYDISPSFGIGVYVVDGTLLGQASGQPPFGLHAVGDDWYAIDVADGSLHFLRDDGEVTGLELVQNSVVQAARKTSDTAAVLAKKPIDLSRDSLQAFVGDYAINPSVRFTIRLGDEGLEAMLTGQPFFPIYAKGDDKFFYKVVDAELHFERDANGEVEALVLHQGGIVQRATRETQ